MVQRYSAAAPATLNVPTAPAFAAWKTIAWTHRAASRDLYDLWLLAHLGLITTEAGELFKRFGPTNKPPTGRLFTEPPDEPTWRRELAGQTRLHTTATTALHEVRQAWSTATDTQQ